MEVLAPGVGGRQVRVDQEGVLVFGRPPDSNGVPLVVIQGLGRVVLDADAPVAQVKDVVDVAVDELDGEEVLASPPGVVHQEAVRLEGLEAEAEADIVVGLHLRQSEVGLLGSDGNRVEYHVVHMRESRRHGKVSSQEPVFHLIQIVHTVEINLGHVAHEITNLKYLNEYEKLENWVYGLCKSPLAYKQVFFLYVSLR